MSLALADYVADAPAPSKLGAILPCLSPADAGSPIDVYLRRVRETLAYGNPAALNGNQFLGRLLALGIVAAAESYFREVLAGSMMLCPMAKSNASAKTVNLGSLLWHGHGSFSRSAFDNSSFSSSDGLRKATLDYVSYKMTDSAFATPLAEFEKVCNIRHSIVHADGILPGKNAVQLDIPPQKGPVKLVIGYNELQDIASIVTTLVATYNRELFSMMCQRWAIEWRKRNDWNPADADKLFHKVWEIFHSAEQNKVRKGRSKITRQSCLHAVKNQFGV